MLQKILSSVTFRSALNVEITFNEDNLTQLNCFIKF